MNKYEIRRLEKAARDKNKQKLIDWGDQFEAQVSEHYRQKYEQMYQEELQGAIDVYTLAIAYTLHFNEDTRFGPKRLPSFMEDLFVTIDMFRTGESKPDDYKDALREAGITICNNAAEGDRIVEEMQYMHRCERALKYLLTNTDTVQLQKILKGEDVETSTPEPLVELG